MGKRGPAPKPTEIRLIEGNPSRRPINDAAPKPKGEASAPDYLSADARDFWLEIVASMPPGIYATADKALLAAFCEAAAQHKAASIAWQRQKAITGKHPVASAGKPSPYVRVMNEAARTMAMLSGKLGLSPADRAGLKVDDKTGGSERWRDLIAS